MSIFSIFDKQQLESLIEPFIPGMAPHITPIKYEALTPDSFLLLFRTTAKNGDNHYFVSLETDFQNSIDGARCTIEDWHDDKVIDFVPLQSKQAERDSDNIDDFQASTSGPYFAMLAEVMRPTHKGYWSDSVVIKPGDKINDIIKDYPKEIQANIRKALSEVLQHKNDPKASFLDTLNSKKQNTMTDDINQTDMIVSLFIQPNGSVELFYNYQTPTVGNRPLKNHSK
jgi:hypothetical protein